MPLMAGHKVMLGSKSKIHKIFLFLTVSPSVSLQVLLFLSTASCTPFQTDLTSVSVIG